MRDDPKGTGPRPPDAGLAVKRIIRDAALRLPEFAHVDASRVLVILGEARRASRASVRPLHFSDSGSRKSASGARIRPLVRIRGRNIRYILTLRPLFFLESSPENRISTVIHEIFHFSEDFDGTLHPGRRHSVLGNDFDRQLSPLIARYLDSAPEVVWRNMAVDGDVRVRMWREKPGLTAVRIEPDGRRIVSGRQVYTEEQTFFSTFRMKTKKKHRRALGIGD